MSAARRARSTVTAQMFPYDPAHQTFVNVYEQGEHQRRRPSSTDGETALEYFAGTRQGVLAVVRKFVPSGVHHILIGPDHLLFLVGLLLLGGSHAAAARRRHGLHGGAQHHAVAGGAEHAHPAGPARRAGHRA